MATVGLVACGSQKLSHKAKAADLYTSTLFRLASRYAAVTYDAWFVLSAKHGLLHPTTEIEPYEHRLAKVEAGEWARKVVEQLRDAAPDATLFALAGAGYVAPLAELMEVITPLRGLQIGERLAWLKNALRGKEQGR